MMKNLILILLFITNILFSQKTCESKEETFEDLNSITKCTIDKSSDKNKKNSRQISVKVSASKKRFLRKREEVKKSVATSASGLNVSGVSKTNHTTEISNSLSSLENITKLTNTLSAEEVKKASKFSTVDNIPLFNDCKGKKGDKALTCFNQEMVKHIQHYFRYPHDAVVNKIQGEVWVRFIIDKNGNVSNIKTLGSNSEGQLLDAEAYRVVSKLPQFIPGIKEKKNISVKYGFPITFSLEE